MVKVTCSDCGEVLLETEGFDLDQSQIPACPKCGSKKIDATIKS